MHSPYPRPTSGALSSWLRSNSEVECERPNLADEQRANAPEQSSGFVMPLRLPVVALIRKPQ